MNKPRQGVNGQDRAGLGSLAQSFLLCPFTSSFCHQETSPILSPALGVAKQEPGYMEAAEPRSCRQQSVYTGIHYSKFQTPSWTVTFPVCSARGTICQDPQGPQEISFQET